MRETPETNEYNRSSLTTASHDCVETHEEFTHSHWPNQDHVIQATWRQFPKNSTVLVPKPTQHSYPQT